MPPKKESLNLKKLDLQKNQKTIYLFKILPHMILHQKLMMIRLFVKLIMMRLKILMNMNFLTAILTMTIGIVRHWIM
jgi:hypothetical protein